jgi:hypothetical protein
LLTSSFAVHFEAIQIANNNVKTKNHLSLNISSALLITHPCRFDLKRLSFDFQSCKGGKELNFASGNTQNKNGVSGERHTKGRRRGIWTQTGSIGRGCNNGTIHDFGLLNALAETSETRSLFIQAAALLKKYLA